jgi:hypothetical protein
MKFINESDDNKKLIQYNIENYEHEQEVLIKSILFCPNLLINIQCLPDANDELEDIKNILLGLLQDENSFGRSPYTYRIGDRIMKNQNRIL